MASETMAIIEETHCFRGLDPKEMTTMQVFAIREYNSLRQAKEDARMVINMRRALYGG